jgi:mono/diheme cytochrome c family protein
MTERARLISRSVALGARFGGIAFIVIAAACGHGTAPVPSFDGVAVADTTNLVARGEYIVRNVAACGGCHGADNAPDGPLSGGAEFKDWRLGTIRASNLTSDTQTGLGAWSDGEIVRAVRNGTARDGRLLAPVMPYRWLHDMSDPDAFAVARYLKSLPPVHHEVKQSPNFAFKMARSTFLGPSNGEAPAPPPRGVTVKYGEYLARNVGLCADCHTPRSGLTSSPDMAELFAGDAHPSKDFPANPSNLTPDSATGIGRWSEADFIRTIRTGVNPRGDSLSTFMPWQQNRRMTDDDLRAIYIYLRSIRAIDNVVPRRGG